MEGDSRDLNIWPLQKFCFSLDIGDLQNSAFQEVTGLDVETEVIEYRDNNSRQFSTVKMPGISKVGNVTLKKGIFVKDNKFWAWFEQIEMNTIKRAPAVIKLLDEMGNSTMVWTLANAFPVKITGTDLKSDGDAVAVETLEIAHEGITIQQG
ncbi:phage tail protein [Paraburkholderia bannensis]|uniref:phage tail protein n=1 Tax=Paraburkholderia bannensis TaxID=765414 RepID=UPI002ABDB8B3|nr:phage tail protein [Paraburkholderia bannensis]